MPTTVTAQTSVEYKNDVNDALLAHFGVSRGDKLRFVTYRQSGANQVSHSASIAEFSKFETIQSNDASFLKTKSGEVIEIEVVATPDLITRIDLQRLNSANALQKTWASWTISPGLDFTNGGTLLITENGLKQVETT